MKAELIMVALIFVTLIGVTLLTIHTFRALS